MMKYARAVVLVVTIVLCLACRSPVLAQDPPGQPDWWGSEEGYTISAVWTLDWDQDHNLDKMTFDSAKSKNSYEPHKLDGTGYAWHDDWWRAKWTSGSRQLTLDIANIYCPPLDKTVWAYWEYGGSEEIRENHVALFAYDNDNKQYTTGVFRGRHGYAYDEQTDWGQDYQYWHIHPQPEWERIVWTLPDNDEIFEIRVGTHCTPELSTWVLLLFTGAMGARLRRRKRGSTA